MLLLHACDSTRNIIFRRNNQHWTNTSSCSYSLRAKNSHQVQQRYSTTFHVRHRGTQVKSAIMTSIRINSTIYSPSKRLPQTGTLLKQAAATIRDFKSSPHWINKRPHREQTMRDYLILSAYMHRILKKDGYWALFSVLQRYNKAQTKLCKNHTTVFGDRSRGNELVMVS